MTYSSLIIFIFEIIGTIAFAFSGAMLAIRKNMDIFGVNVLGVTTAVGGGCIRDLILGINPPKMFQNFSYVGVAILTSTLVFLILYIKQDLLTFPFSVKYEQLINILDAIGLGVFTCIGIRTAQHSYASNTFLLLFVGLITGIGGGMLRDIMAGMTPFVFIKRVYAIAALAGAIVYLLLYPIMSDAIAVLISSIVTVTIRLLAAHYRWNLPRIHKE